MSEIFRKIHDLEKFLQEKFTDVSVDIIRNIDRTTSSS